MNEPVEKTSGVDDTGTHTFNLALLTAFLENIPDIVFFKDRRSRFIAVSRSKARRHDTEPEELIGKTDADVFSEAHARRARLEEENIMASGDPSIGKLEHTQWIDGHQTWTEVTRLPLCDEAGSIIGTFGVSRDVTRAEQLKGELEKARNNVVAASRMAGMAEVATGVLHNVGNVLNSLNVSANVIASTLHQSKAESLGKLSALINEHGSDLEEFVTHDSKGRRVLDLLDSLAKRSLEERDLLLQEVASLQQSIDHVKEIITLQQAYATMAGTVEPLDPVAMMEDALRMNASALVRHEVVCVRNFQPAPRILAEKAKVLQILVNLVRNAKHAADEGRTTGKVITLRIEPVGTDRVRLIVQDNGAGIAAANLAKVFTHGFTTRKSGHGFGLHSSAKVAAEMNGSLTVESDGPGLGARFTLELPAAGTNVSAATLKVA